MDVVLSPDLIEVAAQDGGQPAIVRDERGNAVGGVRLPEFEVPSAEHQGTGKRVEGGSRFAFLYGYSRDFSSQELGELYADVEDFMKKYDGALYEALFGGVVLPEDAAKMREVAATWAAASIFSTD